LKETGLAAVCLPEGAEARHRVRSAGAEAKAIGKGWPVAGSGILAGSGTSGPEGGHMRRILFVAFVAAILSTTPWAPSPCFAIGRDVIGKWADESRSNVYEFKPGGEFRFHRRLGERTPFPGETATGRPIVSWSSSKGVYRTGRKVCREGKRKGDLLFVGDGYEVCVKTRTEGGRLVLGEVYTRGEGEIDILYNQLLERIFDLPRGIREE